MNPTFLFPCESSKSSLNTQILKALKSEALWLGVPCKRRNFSEIGRMDVRTIYTVPRRGRKKTYFQNYGHKGTMRILSVDRKLIDRLFIMSRGPPG